MNRIKERSEVMQEEDAFLEWADHYDAEHRDEYKDETGNEASDHHIDYGNWVRNKWCCHE